jgi:hypothetical protein
MLSSVVVHDYLVAMELVKQPVARMRSLVLKLGQLGNELVALCFCKHLDAGDVAITVV